MDWFGRENLPDAAYPAVNIPHNASFFSNSDYHNIAYVPSNISHQNPRFDYENYLKQKQNDEEFVNNFIKARASKSIIKREPLSVKIFQAKRYLTEIILLKQQLKTDCQGLDISSDEFDVKWGEIIEKQNKINDLLSVFNAESVTSLKRALQKRMKKRTWVRKRKLKQRQMKEEMEEKIREKHALIDKLLSEKCKEVESVKRKEALKRQADSVLHEVRRKKYEGKKMLNMLGALLKLRELRSQQEVAQGGYCSKQITETFNGVINHFQDLWNKQCDIYNLEEKGLEVMLEESEIPHMKISNFQKILNQWEQAIFGNPPTEDDYRFPMQADDDINSLIFIRREWDQFITNFPTILSSCIPVGWVIPPETSDSEWKSYTRSKKL